MEKKSKEKFGDQKPGVLDTGADKQPQLEVNLNTRSKRKRVGRVHLKGIRNQFQCTNHRLEVCARKT
jgi:hypothetical protein